MKIGAGVLLLAIFLVGGCDYNHQKGGATLAPVKPVPTEKLDNPDYETVFALVLKDQCVRCHSAAGGLKGDFDMEGYEKVKAEIRNISNRVFVDQDMPPRGSLTSDQKKILKLWIDNGAPLKTGCDPENDPEFKCTPFVWSNISTKILLPKCAECHQGEAPEGGFNVTALAEVRSKILVIVDRMFVKKDMPAEPVKGLTLEDRRAVLNWIDLGMPE